MCIFHVHLCLQVIPKYSSRDLYDKFFSLGVTMYGQMTAGSYCYIGPQGIVHGTTVSSVLGKKVPPENVFFKPVIDANDLCLLNRLLY